MARPAANNSASVRASSTTTRFRRSRLSRRPSPTCAPPSLIASATDIRPALRAGARPASTAANRLIANAARRTDQFSCTCSRRSRPPGADRKTSRSPRYATIRPVAPPATARSMLSPSNIQTSRARLAPRVARREISRTRSDARDSSNPEAFTHATSNTRKTATPITPNPATASSGVRDGPSPITSASNPPSRSSMSSAA